MQVAIGHRSADRRSRGRGSLAFRARVFARRGKLDRLLAAGADPSWDPELALRAAQLTAPRRRRALAENLIRVARDAGRPARWSCAVPLDRGAVRQAAPELRALAADLGDQPAPQAISLVEQLLRDPGSPLYAAGARTLFAGAYVLPARRWDDGAYQRRRSYESGRQRRST